MKAFLPLVLSLLGGAALNGQEEGYHIYQHPGYDTTPLISREGYQVHQDDRLMPPRVTLHAKFAGQGPPPPADATVLFDGTSIDQFQANQWHIEDGLLIATQGGLETREAYGDFQLHVEWRTPDPALATKTGNIGNSGLYIMGRYELQIYDSYSSRIFPDGGAGAIYGQTPPLVNVARRPHEWQTYDVIFHAPVFVNQKLLMAARITVLHNGVLVQDHTRILGPTKHKSALAYQPHPSRLPLTFQAHGSEVAFRNIWIRDLE